MKSNKRMAFSLAEMMVVMLILTIIMAAMAPIISKRTKNSTGSSSGTEIWQWSAANGGNTDTYFGAAATPSVIIGTTATNGTASKLLIDSANKAITQEGALSVPQIAFKSQNSDPVYMGITPGRIFIGTVSPYYQEGITAPDSTPLAGRGSIAIGNLVKVKKDQDIAIGYMAMRYADNRTTPPGDPWNGFYSGNLAIGSCALKNVLGNCNIGVGGGAGCTLLPQYHCISIGLNNGTAGAANIAIGNVAGSTVTSATNSISIGTYANGSGNESIAIGNYAKTTTSVDSIAIGNNALTSNTTCPIVEVNGGTWEIGHNIAIGNGSVAWGGQSMAVGHSSYAGNTAGYGCCTAVGRWSRATGECSDAFGTMANASGSHSAALGNGAVASGSYSIASGNGALASGASSISIGELSNATHSNSVAIGVLATTTANNQIVLGRTTESVVIPGTLTIGGYGLINRGYYWGVSDRRLKNVYDKNLDGLDKIRQLKPYNFCMKSDKKKTPRVGVIAQDLQKIFPHAVTKNKDGYLMIRQDDMFYAMVNAIKELDKIVQGSDKKLQGVIADAKILGKKFTEICAKIQKLDDKIIALAKYNKLNSKKIQELEHKNSSLEKQNKELDARLKRLEKITAK